MLKTTNSEALSTQVTENKKNQKVLSSTAKARVCGVGRSFKNLSTTTKSAKSKKPKLTKSKKSNSVKTNSSEMDFLISGTKKAFIYLQKAFIKALIFRHFDLEHHI